jgi:hypothetical protein
LDDLIKDVKNTNDITLTQTVKDTTVSKIQSEHDTLIPTFKENKDSFTVDHILEFIGTRVVFE